MEQTKKSGADRGLNHTVVQSFLDGLILDEKEAKSNLVGRWLRELTPEQANALARGGERPEAVVSGGTLTPNGSGRNVPSMHPQIDHSEKQSEMDGGALRLAPSREKAYHQYLDAIAKNPQMSGATDKDVYDWLEKHAEGEQLPRYDTWSRYLREAREHYQTQKNTPRAGRATGKSVVSEREIDRVEPDN